MAQPKHFLVSMHGVNPQGVFGIFDDIRDAVGCVYEAAALEEDVYHDFQITEVPIEGPVVNWLYMEPLVVFGANEGGPYFMRRGPRRWHKPAKES